MGEKSLKIRIVYPGRIKNSFAKEGFEEYVKRCGRFYKMEVVSLPSSRLQDKRKAMKKESEKVIKYLRGDKFILLDVNGVEKDSMEFAEMLRKYTDHGNNLIFVVGGVLGVDDELKKKASVRISLSKLTFTHSLSLLILAEQLYRSMKILHGQPYNH